MFSFCTPNLLWGVVGVSLFLERPVQSLGRWRRGHRRRGSVILEQASATGKRVGCLVWEKHWTLWDMSGGWLQICQQCVCMKKIFEIWSFAKFKWKHKLWKNNCNWNHRTLADSVHMQISAMESQRHANSCITIVQHWVKGGTTPWMGLVRWKDITHTQTNTRLHT